MTDTTKADKLGEEGALRAEALHEARKVLAPVAIFGSGQTLDEDGVASLIELAEYIATGQHPVLDDIDEDDPILDGSDHTGTGESPRGDGTGPHLHVADRAEAKVHPLTHREPSRWAILIDRQGDGWEYSETRGGWTMAGSLTACTWGPGLAWGPFTITGAAPSVADELAKWNPERDPEPRRTATLVDEVGREWEHKGEGNQQGWRIVRNADGSAYHGAPRCPWGSWALGGRVFTIRTEGTKRSTDG